MNAAIFLGAGASASEGASIQTHLFKDYFKLLKSRKGVLDPYTNYEAELKIFFDFMFDIDVTKSDLDELRFPTFEEALSILDLAELKKETFRQSPNIIHQFNRTRKYVGHQSSSNDITSLRLYLIFLITDILNERLKDSKGIHKRLINNLTEQNLIDETIFITTNYDILCDNALLSLYPDRKVDYGVDFINYKENTFERPDLNSIKYFKLHGSLNWLHCPTCNNLRITPYEKGVYNLIADPVKSFCIRCATTYSPIIVPPTFYKDLSKVFLNQVWNKTENELLDVEHLIFCGYSFPDSDIHVKYLMKRIQKNRPRKSLKITIINNHKDKKEDAKVEEENRYKRFLGSKIQYTSYSFEDFASNPKIVME